MEESAMDTYYAPAARASSDELRRQVEFISVNPIVDGLMSAVGGLLAVLNEQRQVLAVNETLLASLGITNSGEALGLRPGEALGCEHSHDMPAGCGTSQFCQTCGAVISIVTSLGQNKPVEKICALRACRNGRESDMLFRVRSCPLTLDGFRLVFLFLQDITQQQHWAALERVFFHDMNNLMGGVVLGSQMLSQANSGKSSEMANVLHMRVLRLAQELKIQQCLTRTGMRNYQPLLLRVSAHQVFDELGKLYGDHPSALNKRLRIEPADKMLLFETDINLLLRVLGNMTINALEASADGQEVRVWLEKASPRELLFCVHNEQAMSDAIKLRVFQRNFSTKGELGRGLGTYSMKVFGENYLGGKISFTSEPGEGTTFRFFLPLA